MSVSLRTAVGSACYGTCGVPGPEVEVATALLLWTADKVRFELLRRCIALAFNLSYASDARSNAPFGSGRGCVRSATPRSDNCWLCVGPGLGRCI